MNKGWIKLHRKIRANPIFNDLQLFRLWIICLTEASHKEHEQLIGKQTVKLKPGQFVTGRYSLLDMYNQGLKPSEKVKGEKTVFRWLEKLEKGQYLTIKKTNKFSIVTVDNWEFYQSEDEEKTDKKTNKRPTKDHQMTTNKNGKNGKNDKEIKTLSKIRDLRATYSPEVQTLINNYWSEIQKTRTTNKISFSVILKNMEKWEKFDPVVVQYALKKHLDNYNDGDRNENYTLGIMRNTSPEEAKDNLSQKQKPYMYVVKGEKKQREPSQYDNAF